MVVWRTFKIGDDSVYIFMQIFSKLITLESPIIQIDSSENILTDPYVITSESGKIIVIWNCEECNYPSDELYGAVYNEDGIQIAAQFIVNQENGYDIDMPSVFILNEDEFVVTWSGAASADATKNAYARRYQFSGISVGNEFRLINDPGSNQAEVQSAVLADGSIVMIWQTLAESFQINGRILNSEFTELSQEFIISSDPFNDMYSPRVIPLTGGGFFAVWLNGNGIYGRGFENTGSPIDGELQLNENGNHANKPSVRSFYNTRFMAVWEIEGLDGSGKGIVGRIFSLLCDDMNCDSCPKVSECEQCARSYVLLEGECIRETRDNSSLFISLTK